MDYFLSFLTIFNMYLMGNKTIWGPRTGVIFQFFWAYWAIFMIHQPGIVVGCFVLLLVQIRNWIKWSAEKPQVVIESVGYNPVPKSKQPMPPNPVPVPLQENHDRLGKKIMKRLFLDDDPKRAKIFLDINPDATWVETAQECTDALTKEEWDVVYLDHDLGGRIFVDEKEENTGSGVVRYILANDCVPKTTYFVVHSYNTKAAVNMVRELRIEGYYASYVPFGVKPSYNHDLFVQSICHPPNRWIQVDGIIDSMYAEKSFISSPINPDATLEES